MVGNEKENRQKFKPSITIALLLIHAACRLSKCQFCDPQSITMSFSNLLFLPRSFRDIAEKQCRYIPGLDIVT